MLLRRLPLYGCCLASAADFSFAEEMPGGDSPPAFSAAVTHNTDFKPITPFRHFEAKPDATTPPLFH